VLQRLQLLLQRRVWFSICHFRRRWCDFN
jgi:hypothetical protein